MVVGSVYESLTWKIFFTVITELLAENVKWSNEVEGLQYLRRDCFELENMQKTPPRKILGIRGNHDTYKFVCCLNRGANSFECICFNPYFYHFIYMHKHMLSAMHLCFKMHTRTMYNSEHVFVNIYIYITPASQIAIIFLLLAHSWMAHLHIYAAPIFFVK